MSYRLETREPHVGLTTQCAVEKVEKCILDLVKQYLYNFQKCAFQFGYSKLPWSAEELFNECSKNILKESYAYPTFYLVVERY